MKINTLNSKNPDYSENHEIYVGTQTGSFKRLNVSAEKAHTQENLQDISQLNKDSCITALDFGNEEKTEILIGRTNKTIQKYSTDRTFSDNLELIDGPIVGVAYYDSKIVAGLATGKIQMVQEPEPLIITTGDHMSRMRQCSMEKKLIAVGGKDRQNNLKIYDLSAEGKMIFKSKNLPNDSLQLEIPIWDSDLRFIDANTIATCSRYGYVRLYDIRAQRRPVSKFSTDDNQMCFCSMAAKDNLIYTGTTMGIIKAFDTRKFKNYVHTYKGFTGSVSDLNLDKTGKYLVSASLDRYVRVHQTDSCAMLYQCYVKSKATRVLIREFEVITENDEGSQIEIEAVVEDENDKVKKEEDDEYEKLFSNMETICEKEDTETRNTPRKRKESLNDSKKINKRKKELI